MPIINAFPEGGGENSGYSPYFEILSCSAHGDGTKYNSSATYGYYAACALSITNKTQTSIKISATSSIPSAATGYPVSTYYYGEAVCDLGIKKNATVTVTVNSVAKICSVNKGDYFRCYAKSSRTKTGAGTWSTTNTYYVRLYDSDDNLKQSISESLGTANFEFS